VIKEGLDATKAGGATPVKELLSDLEAMRSVGEAIDAEDLERQLTHVVAVLMNLTGDRLSGLAARMGIPGPRATLRAAGETAGLSGMRIQRLQVALMDRVKGNRYMYLPAIDAAEEALEQASPIWVTDATHHIAEKSISRGTIDVEVFVDEWLPALGRHVLSVTQYDGASWVICRARGTVAHQLRMAGYIDSETGREIVEAARRLCQSVGVANTAWIAEEVDLGDQEQRHDLVGLLKRSSEFSFLGPAWFWSPTLPRRRNRLENALRKMVAVSQRLELGDALEGLDRCYRQAGVARRPPPDVIAQLVAAHPYFGYDDGYIIAHPPLDPSTELPQTERLFVEVLSSVPGGVLDRESLRRACIERGMNAGTFAQYTTFSPILMQPARNLWALRGRDIDESVIRRLSRSPRRLGKPVTATRTADGRLAVSWPIRTAESRVFTLPVAERYGFTDSGYRAFDVEGAPHGGIWVDDEGVSYGYNLFLRVINAGPGDRLVATFDQNSRVVILEMERRADRQWVGDLGNCFLHNEGWALRLYVDDDLLSGGSWEVPFSLADATGIRQGAWQIPWREDESVRLTITRDELRCTCSSLEQVLSAQNTRRQDRVFVELHTSWFALTRQGPANPDGDPLDELFASAGINQRGTESKWWSELSRALGGPSDGGRNEVEERLRERGDQVALGLLHHVRQSASPPESEWPASWEYVSELDPNESCFAIRSGDGAIRVAAGTAIRGSALPWDSIIDRRGLVWVDNELGEPAIGSLTEINGFVLSAQEPAWVRWARAEHHARRASLGGIEWVLERGGDNWLFGEYPVPDLLDGLESIPAASSVQVTRTSKQSAAFPSSAFAFRRIVRLLIRDGLVALRSDNELGFIADFDESPSRRAVGLAELVSD
jgi:hypothetical protein